MKGELLIILLVGVVLSPSGGMHYTCVGADFVMCIMADSHIGMGGLCRDYEYDDRVWEVSMLIDNHTYTLVVNEETLEDVVGDIVPFQKDLVWMVGDCVDIDNKINWDIFNRIYQSDAEYVGYTLGNHDVTNETHNKTREYFDANNIRFISLGCDNRTEPHNFSASVDWFNATVKDANEKDKTVVVFCHYPIFNTTNGSGTKSYYLEGEGYDWIIENRDIHFWFHGHIHCDQMWPDTVVEMNGTVFVNVATICGTGGCKVSYSRWFYFYDDYVIMRSYNHNFNYWADNNYKFEVE